MNRLLTKWHIVCEQTSLEYNIEVNKEKYVENSLEILHTFDILFYYEIHSVQTTLLEAK